MMKMPRQLAAIIPPNTAVPTALWVAAPAPVAITSGTRPNMEAKDVIITAQNLSAAASVAACTQKRQDQDGRRLARGGLFLERGYCPLIAVGRRQDTLGERLHSGHRLAGGIAWRRPAVDGDGAQVVVADYRCRRSHQSNLGDSTQRHKIALGGANPDSIDVARRSAVRGFGLDLDLPGAPEEVEVVGVEAAHRR